MLIGPSWKVQKYTALIALYLFDKLISQSANWPIKITALEFKNVKPNHGFIFGLNNNYMYITK